MWFAVVTYTHYYICRECQKGSLPLASTAIQADMMYLLAKLTDNVIALLMSMHCSDHVSMLTQDKCRCEKGLIRRRERWGVVR